MKRLALVTLSIMLAFFACFCLSSCKSKELQFDKEYVYSSISFKKAKDLKLEDLPFFNHLAIVDRPIKTIADYEKMSRDKIDDFYFVFQVENKLERVYIKPIINYIKIIESENAYVLCVKYSEDEDVAKYNAVRSNDNFTCLDSTAKVKDFYFKNGKIHYELAINEKFSIIYNYK